MSDLHDALRAQGLVPPVEDVHFGACSTDYRQKLDAAEQDYLDTLSSDDGDTDGDTDESELHQRIAKLTAQNKSLKEQLVRASKAKKVTRK